MRRIMGAEWCFIGSFVANVGVGCWNMGLVFHFVLLAFYFMLYLLSLSATVWHLNPSSECFSWMGIN